MLMANATMKIKVTQKHIDSGTRHDCTACPVALASWEQVPCIKEVTVGSVIMLNIQGRTHWSGHVYSEEVKDFIERFDDDKVVVPFEFELNGIK